MFSADNSITAASNVCRQHKTSRKVVGPYSGCSPARAAGSISVLGLHGQWELHFLPPLWQAESANGVAGRRTKSGLREITGLALKTPSRGPMSKLSTDETSKTLVLTSPTLYLQINQGNSLSGLNNWRQCCPKWRCNATAVQRDTQRADFPFLPHCYFLQRQHQNVSWIAQAYYEPVFNCNKASTA